MAEQLNTTQQRDAERPVIGGKYVLDKLLGQGGYSWVYLARHKQIQDLRYVVKLLKPSHLGNDQVLRRFEQEATTLARLRSPRIVRIVDYGPTEAGIPYIVSEYIEGVTLGHVLREHGRLSPWLTAHLAIQVLEGLVDAHTSGVVHRDLKPDNILVTRGDGENAAPSAMVLDFGIAKVTQDAADDADATVEGLACSPRYAAPEVLTREPTYKSDIYALGLVLAEMLTGTPVFRGKHNLILASEQLSSEKVPLPEEVITSPLGSIIVKACEKQQTKRYQDAGSMLEDLREMRQTLKPFEEAGRNEIDLPALITARNERPVNDADTTALTANLHTMESRRNNTGSGTVSVDVDLLVAAQRSHRINKVLLPILVAAVIVMLVVIGVIILTIQRSQEAATATAGAATATDSAAQPSIPAPTPGSPEDVVARAQRTLRTAYGQAGANSISISTDVTGAELWFRDQNVGQLPLQNVVTDFERPLDLTVRAPGYEPVTLQVMQTGRVQLRANLEEQRRATGSTGTTGGSRTPPATTRTPPTTTNTGSSSGSSRPRGDFRENPF